MGVWAPAGNVRKQAQTSGWQGNRPGVEADEWHTSRLPDRGLRASRLHKPWAALVGAKEHINRLLYVDDSTAWASGPVNVVVETIAKAVSNTRLFEAAFGWQLHPQKSVVGCTNPKGRKRLAAESGLPAATRIKDLVAIHEVGVHAVIRQPPGPRPR